MNETTLIIEALSKKYRWNTSKGVISMEDLFDLSLEGLDNVYLQLKKETNNHSDSLLCSQKENPDDVENNNKMKIVKLIFDIKKEKQSELAMARENAKKRQEIMNIMQEKKNEKLKNMSEEDLMRLLNEMSNN
ncbi:MAG: hypothetical protein ACLTBR_03150 [Anaerostipes sp.]|uniref:hypothetical protein n=1 Tax=Anaerostipes sp. TaxID=1872530 RepID=UPI00399624D2